MVDGKAVRTPVQTGVSDGSWVEVTGNLVRSAGSIAADGGYALPENIQRKREAHESAQAAANPPDPFDLVPEKGRPVLANWRNL